jgi:hypothetical protein
MIFFNKNQIVGVQTFTKMIENEELVKEEKDNKINSK